MMKKQRKLNKRSRLIGFCAAVWVMVILLSLIATAATDLTSTVGVDGLAVSGDSGWTANVGQVNASVVSEKTTTGSGCEQSTTYTPKEIKLTLTNNNSTEATLSFDYGNISNLGTLTIDGSGVTETGRYSKLIGAGDSIEIVLKSSSENETATTVTISGISLTIAGTCDITFKPISGVAYTVGEKTVSDTTGAVSFSGSNTDAYTISITTSHYYLTGAKWEKFDETGSVVESGFLASTNGVIYPTFDCTITPLVAKDDDEDGVAPFRVGNNYYWNWDSAISAAGTALTVILNDDYTLPSGNYAVPSGVTFLVPYDSANTLVTNGDATLDAYDTSVTARSQYRALTIASGAKITVASGGAISISSGRANQFIGQVGPYGAIYMESGSNITVQSGGTLYAWGYIFHGAEGSGTVTIESGGTIYEPISIMDYPGSATLATTLTDAKVFPMRSYAIRNVEVPMTLNSGAKEYVFTCLYGNSPLVGTNPLYILLIANGAVNNETPVFQNSGTITKSYVNSRQHMDISGNLTLNALTVEVAKSMGTITISSSETSGFYIPSCYDMTLISGTVTLNDNVIMCEGSTFTINKDATVNTNGKNLYVLDADNDPGAVVNTNGCSIDVQDVHGKYYTNVPKDAILDINGTLITSGNFYTSAAGACITSSEGGGKIQLSGTSASTTVNVKNTNSYTSVGITAARLLNINGEYISTADKGTGTYTYVDGYWHKDCDGSTETTTVDATCTADGSTTTKCTCGIINTTEIITQLGHTEGAPAEENRVEATETADGSYDSVVYCSVCGTEISRNTITIPATGTPEPTYSVTITWDNMTYEFTPEFTWSPETLSYKVSGGTWSTGGKVEIKNDSDVSVWSSISLEKETDLSWVPEITLSSYGGEIVEGETLTSVVTVSGKPYDENTGQMLLSETATQIGTITITLTKEESTS